MAISQSLAIPHNKINITVRRLGGAYGAKIARSALVTSACALVCFLTNRPVRFVMQIEAMMSICGKSLNTQNFGAALIKWVYFFLSGKRYPCANKYRVKAETRTGKIRHFDNFYVQEYGYTLNEMNDPSVLNTFLLGYVSTGWKHLGKPLLTSVNLSNWARAPGSVESIAMGETIIEHIAHTLKMDPVRVRLNNMPQGDVWKSLVESILTDVGKPDRGFEL